MLSLGKRISYFFLMVFGLALLASCGDDESFVPMARNDDGSALSSREARSSSSDRSSSSKKSSSSAWSSSSFSQIVWAKFTLESKEELFNPEIEYGTLIDERDGKEYRTVEVNGKVWMAENLNFADSAMFPLLEGGSLCYADDAENCRLFGRLYNRRAAMNDTLCDFNKNCFFNDTLIQGICPDGWHIPWFREALEIVLAHDQTAMDLMSAKGWHETFMGRDTYGLSIAGAGEYQSYYSGLGLMTRIWVYEAKQQESQIYIGGQSDYSTISTSIFDDPIFASVRCIKDYR